MLEHAARQAAPTALGFFGGPVRQWLKGDGTPVSEADIAVDNALRETLMSARPDHGWLSEESGSRPGRSGRTIIVDPIDGTRAFLSGQTAWTLALAIVDASRPLAAAIYRPSDDVMFAAAVSEGAFRNGARLSVADRGLSGARVAAPGATFKAGTLSSAGASKASRVPSLALRLAYVAARQLDAVVTKDGPYHWDVAAADLIVHEAGGTVIDAAGAVIDYGVEGTKIGPVIAGPPRLAEALRERLAPHWSDAA